jgi:phosphocarrier protein
MNDTPSSIRCEICNQRGLHARASAKFVNCVDQFKAKITVEKDGMIVGGTSIMGLMMLAASKGSFINVSATGEDAQAALDAIKTLVADKFGEEI